MTARGRVRSAILPILLVIPAVSVTLPTPGAMATSGAGCTRGWRLVTSPASKEVGSLSMTGPDDGWAVGVTQIDQVLRTRTVRISDGVWSVVPSPNVDVGDSLIHNRLRSVAAVGTSAFAVGERTNNAGKAKSIAMRWTGTEWVVTRVPRPAKTARTGLVDVAALSASDAWAVGAFYDPAIGRVLRLVRASLGWHIVEALRAAEPGALFGSADRGRRRLGTGQRVGGRTDLRPGPSHRPSCRLPMER